MDAPEEIRRVLKESDAQTLEARAGRMAQVRSYSYDGIYSPLLEYLEELDKLYVNGHFMATVVFASTIIEYVLREKLYAVADTGRVEKAGLGELCTMARRRKLLAKNAVEQIRLVNKMRNTVIHADMSYAQELMSYAMPEIEDPYVRMTWFFSGSQLSLMADVCSGIARKFAGSFGSTS